ncbi:MAG TPA: hypothetical protein VL240_06895 [Candidatus Binatia bacterium]|nr:hypothetical protein [Candidatus Binatia bacterium]
MERIDDRLHLELLRGANARFERFFARFSGAPVLGTDEEVEALLQIERTLETVGDFLDGRLQQSQHSEVRQELGRYRANLLRLRQELAIMQSSAADSQTRLLARQKHLHAAKAWCAVSRVTT